MTHFENAGVAPPWCPLISGALVVRLGVPVSYLDMFQLPAIQVPEIQVPEIQVPDACPPEIPDGPGLWEYLKDEES
jgi:hypothetical protein